MPRRRLLSVSDRVPARHPQEHPGVRPGRPRTPHGAKAPDADLISVITKVHGRSGESRDSIKTKLDARYGRPSLTAREIEVLECFAEGLRTRDIAATLRVSDHTVRMHMKNIYVKLEVQGRAEALAVALRRGYVRLGAGRQLCSAEPDTNTPEIEERVGPRGPRQLTA